MSPSPQGCVNNHAHTLPDRLPGPDRDVPRHGTTFVTANLKRSLRVGRAPILHGKKRFLVDACSPQAVAQVTRCRRDNLLHLGLHLGTAALATRKHNVDYYRVVKGSKRWVNRVGLNISLA